MNKAATLLLLASSLAGSLPAQTAPATLTVVNQDGVSKTLTMADLKGYPQIEVRGTTHDSTTAAFRGPSLQSVLSGAGAPTGHALRGPNLTLVVLAEARDGYKVAYALSELDGDLGAKTAIIALTENGKPLPDEEGPLRIVMPGETHHARWIRQVTTLRIVAAR